MRLQADFARANAANQPIPHCVKNCAISNLQKTYSLQRQWAIAIVAATDAANQTLTRYCYRRVRANTPGLYSDGVFRTRSTTKNR